MDTEEVQLVESLRGGDKAVFRKLFSEYYSLLCRYASIFIRQEEVEDVIQDFFAHFWENRELLVIQTSIRSYLYAAVRNRCISYIRHRQSSKAYQEYLYNRLKDRLEEPDEAYFNDIIKQLSDAIAELPEQDRKIFELSRFTDMSNREIAQTLGVSEKAIEYHITRSLKVLRERLKDYLYTLLMLI